MSSSIDSLASLTRAQIIRCLFPEVKIDMDEGVPGRSWIARQHPGGKTKLDNAVRQILDRQQAPRILPQSELLLLGIECPYYAVRYFALMGALKASIDHNAIKETRIIRLRKQELELVKHIERCKEVHSTCNYLDAMRIGDPYWLPISEVRSVRMEVERDGKRAINAIQADIDAARIYIEHVKTELKRLSPSNRRPDAWQTSFLTVLANIYCTLTGKRRPSENDAVLNSLLAAATEDLGFRIDDWKQIRALLKRAQNDPSGSGFDRGRDGRFGMHSMTHVEQRGREIANLVSRIVDDGDSIASAIVGMRDESIISEVLILREIVLRPYLEREGLLTETLMVQLGWKDISVNIVKEKLLEVINRAREGSAKAVATLALAHKTDNPAIKFMLHTARGAPFLFMSRDRVMKDLQPKAKRDVLAEVLWNLLSITDPNCKILGMAAQIRLSDEDPVAAKARDERYQKAEDNYQEWKSKRTIGTSERIELSLLINRSVSVVR